MPDTTIDPLLRSLETPLRMRLFPLGFPLDIESNDPRVLDNAQSSFGVFTQSQNTAPLRMRIVCVPGANSTPPWPEHSFRGHRDWFTVVSGPENFLVADLERAEAQAFFSPALIEDRDYFCITFFEASVYMTLQRHWMTPFHAAAVERDGFGICLAGSSGAGKSTLAYACARAGFGLLSDNTVYLVNSDTHPALLGNPSRLTLRAAARALFPELHSMATSHREKGDEILAIRAQTRFPERLVTRAEPGPVIFLQRGELERGGTDAALDEIPADEARDLLFQDRNPYVDEPHVLAESKRVIARTVRNGAYRMRYTTVEQAIECLKQIPLPQRTMA